MECTLKTHEKTIQNQNRTPKNEQPKPKIGLRLRWQHLRFSLTVMLQWQVLLHLYLQKCIYIAVLLCTVNKRNENSAKQLKTL